MRGIMKIKRAEEIKGMRNYMKKPIIISAKQINKEFTINSLGGVAKGKAGDYIIKDEEGEIYPCDRELFEEDYIEE